MNWIPVENNRNFFISFINKLEKGEFELWLDSPAGIGKKAKHPETVNYLSAQIQAGKWPWGIRSVGWVQSAAVQC